MRLKDKVVIVTGAARNIGQVYATGLAKEGSRIVAADIRDCEETVERIKAAGGEAAGVHVDVSNEEATRNMARTAHERYGRIDGIVNNAALFHDIELKPFYEIAEEEWDRLMAINLKGVFHCCKAVFPYMKEQGHGRIINIASNTVHKGTENFLHYVTSKAGVIGLTRALARECGPYGINVNAVSPDYIPHERDARERPQHDEMIRRGRIIQRTEVPADMLGSLIFFLSADSDFITAQSLLINGGAVMQ